ncbi:hypothetical protein ARMGADRAFT_1077823 [Armillaria gallica]|uniref:Uncharacterized protein n=1 Tax=Armillaria gallica TaxID=47427 RepID=A0A2H3DUA9_ARMGA|nr:hypothetical protein ARMGADRAFT_1077823 [Armillaria gallica]
MKKYPDFEYDANKDQLKGEVWSSLQLCNLYLTDIHNKWDSWYFLHVKTKDQCGPAIVDMFKRPLVIWDADVGEIERPLHGLKSFSVGHSLFNFINLLNPLEENKNQLLRKWALCIALYLSVFILGSHLREEYIHEQDESVSA